MAFDWSGLLFGQAPRVEQINKFNPQQQGAQSNALQQALSLLQGQGSGLSNQFNFAPIAQQARNQFETKTIPGIAERFSSLPGQGGARSGAFGASLANAGRDFDLGLLAQQNQYGLQQQGLNQNLLQNLLTFGGQQQQENIPVAGSTGLTQQTLNALAKILGSWLGGPK